MAERELVFNKKQAVLQQRNNQLVLITVSLGLSAIAIGIFFRNQYNKNRFLKVQLRNSENEKLIAQIEATLAGEENERERIAQELHDNVVSELMALQLNLKEIEYHYPDLQHSQKYSNILYQAEDTVDKLRSTSHNMMPTKLKEYGLVKTIESFVNRMSNHKLDIRFFCLGEKVKLDDTMEKILLSITQELTHNIVKHAQASEAVVQLNYYDDTISLTVEDNGVGMSSNTMQDKEGMGWDNIRKNVAALHGHIDIQSSEQEGTTILIEVPTKKQEEITQI